MKQAWTDLKSFVTVAMIALLFIIVVASLFGFNLAENLLILVTNLSTAVFTYYFTKKEKNEREEQNNEK
jgi:L-asparagine transporter-like permease